MKRMSAAFGVVVLAGGVAAGCGGREPEQGTGNASTPMASGAEPGTSAAIGDVEITFESQPDPPRMGENTFEVTVMSEGEPVTDAAVSAEFVMPAMPSMNMAEMRHSVPMEHQGGGRYRGSGRVAMTGSWDVTVRVSRGGQEIGSRTLAVTAQ